MMSDEGCRLPQEREWFEQGRSESGMVLQSHVGVTVEGASVGSEMGREHQDADIVEQACELEVVHCVRVELNRLSDPERNDRGPFAVSGLPRQDPIDFLADLTDQNTFDVATGGFRESKTIDLLEQRLDPQDPRLNLC